jgi:two-component system, OmpR family, phosphate regulon response regulator PhoB
MFAGSDRSAGRPDGVPLDESAAFADGRLVLVVEDEPQVRAVVRSVLENDGLSVAVASTAREALSACNELQIDAVVLDLTLPDSTGFDVLIALRRLGSIPILVVSGRGDDEDRVRGLEFGADDYLSKPFYLPELTARVRCLLRRTSPPDENPRSLGWTGVTIDPLARTVRVADHDIKLTRLEFDLVALLAAYPGRAFTKEELLRRVWASSTDWQSPATVTEHVRRIRRKLDDPEGVVIQTVHGVGYRLAPPAGVSSRT